MIIIAVTLVYIIGFIIGLYILVVGAPEEPTIIQWLAVVFWPVTIVFFAISFVQDTIARRR